MAVSVFISFTVLAHRRGTTAKIGRELEATSELGKPAIFDRIALVG